MKIGFTGTMSVGKTTLVKALQEIPDLKEYTETYHIIRQADILAAYDIDRAVIYGMMAVNKDYKSSLEDSLDLFDKRVLQHIYDNTFYHESALKIGQELHKNAESKIILLKKYNL